MTIGLESFEGLTAGTNIADLGFGFLRPGTTGIFEFDSGVRLLDPIPNVAPGDAVVGDFSISLGATWGVTIDPGGSPGDVLSFLDVPLGSAYIGRNVEHGGTLAFGFDQPVFRVGAAVNAGAKVGIAAYDASGKLISGARINQVAAADWDENFLQVSSKKPIAKVVFTGDFLIIDNVSFDTEKFGLVNGTRGDDRIVPGSGGTATTTDMVYAKLGNDKVFADAGDDTVDGGKGNDKLHGGDGDDTLTGGLGRDKLWGDDGQNSFVFNSLDAVDTIKDFTLGEDNIILSRAVFTQLDLGELGFGQLSESADTADVRIIYESGTGRLLYDSDGNGAIQAVQFAKIAPGLMLGTDSFFVV